MKEPSDNRSGYRNTILGVAVAVIALAIIVIPFINSQDTDSYPEEVKAFRSKKQEMFATGPSSPIIDKENFNGLSYYPPDPDYKIVADLDEFDDKKLVTIPTSDGEKRVYREFGTATFELKGEEQQLLLYQPQGIQEGPEKLFVPFFDETNDVTTYGGGRYLDVSMPDAGADEITLDFNYAYNPFCVYNADYSCPLPPLSNRITVEIKAGEKIYGKD